MKAVIGAKGEREAAKYLLSLGYELREENVRVGPHDEIDCIAFDPEDRVIVFVEVKARTAESDDFHPELNMTPRKRTALTRAARRWVARKKYEGGYRLDLVCVANGVVLEHLKEIEWAE